MFDELKVECRAGYKADETPVRFVLDGQEKTIVEICDRWYAPEADYFKVRAADDYLYLLRHDHRTDAWTLRYIRFRDPRTPMVSPGNDAGREPS
jgi:hypothetical protein